MVRFPDPTLLVLEVAGPRAISELESSLSTNVQARPVLVWDVLRPSVLTVFPANECTLRLTSVCCPGEATSFALQI